ncbi:MAG TPA: DUF2855 family protein [Porticoccus sp.]|nr:DUF2855 family protein [Porticoccus sp.]
MTQCTELWVDRGQLRNTKVVSTELAELNEGEVLVAIDKFGLTANNVSYAVSGDAIGYWRFYPAQDEWGKVPVWGCANVIASTCAEVPVGERLWGFFPMASHVVLQPGNIVADQFIDFAQHRKDLPSLYNAYRRTQAEPDFLSAMETERCLLFPLFATSFMLYDYLLDNNFFGVQQILIGSVSSKTGFGLAKMLQNDPQVTPRIIGLTSAPNVDFVEGLNCCDEIIIYGDEANVDGSLTSAYVDMSGDVRLTTALHTHVGDNMVESCMVGATHWEHGGKAGQLPGAKPKFFFAPGHIAKREAEWGPGVAMAKAMAASAEVAKSIDSEMTVEWTRDVLALEALWLSMLDNKVSPQRGQMVSLL